MSRRSRTANLAKAAPKWARKKSSGVKSQLITESFDEWIKALRIKTREGVMPFPLYEWQSEFTNLLQSNPRTPITLLSSRQTGKTADLLATMIYFALKYEQFTGLFIHRKTEEAFQLSRRIRKMLPEDVRLSSKNLGLLEFERTGSSLYFRSSNHKQEDGAESTARGLESCDVIVIEEASHTLNTQEVIGVCGPTMTHSAMANIILVGTSGRRNSYFYETLVSGFGGRDRLEGTLDQIRKEKIAPFQVSKAGDRLSVITNWRAIPEFLEEGHDETGYPNYLHRIKKEQDLTDAQIDSEHELYFDADSGSAMFPLDQIKAATVGQWAIASRSRQYFAGVDGSGKPKEGRKGDYTVCVIIEKDGDRVSVVAMYRKRANSFTQRYQDICNLLNRYMPSKVYVEANDGLGQTYEENLLMGCPGLEIERFVNTAQRKSLAVNHVTIALEKGTLKFPATASESEIEQAMTEGYTGDVEKLECAIAHELENFQQFDDGTMGAVGKDLHDDTVMGLALAIAASYADEGKNKPLAKAAIPTKSGMDAINWLRGPED